MASNRGTERGFTLVELLVAMTLLGLLSAALFGSLSFGARSWEAVAGGAADRDAVASAQTFLRARLGEVSVPRAGRAARAGTASRVAGGEDGLAFSAPWLSAIAQGGVYDFRVWFEPGLPGDPGRLMLSWRLSGANESDGDLGDLAGTRVLLDGVADAAFAYWDRGTGDRPAGWEDRWEDREETPGLVRLDLVMADTRIAWPEFVVAPGS